jgi:hypothetical protein
MGVYLRSVFFLTGTSCVSKKVWLKRGKKIKIHKVMAMVETARIWAV